MKIIGNPVGAPMPRTDYMQEDPAKSDYLKGREVLAQKIEEAVQAAGTGLSKTGGTMEGPIDMGGNHLTGLPAPAAAGDAASWGAVQGAVQAAAAAADAHAGAKTNPHAVTAAQTGAAEMKLLWENAAPWGAFAAQTISVDLSGYDYIEVHYRASSFGTYKSQVCKVGENVHLDCVTGSTGAIEGAYCLSIFRIGTVSGTGIAFSKTVSVRQHGTDKAEFTENNAFAVPARIFGIKGVT